jgi:hypothetical protein
MAKGKTNNPHGRPAGATNKISETVKRKIVEFIEADFDGYIEDIRRLEPKDRVKAVTELIKMLVPRPVDREESDLLTLAGSALVERLFIKESPPPQIIDSLDGSAASA